MSQNHRRAAQRNPIPSPSNDAERACPLVRITQLTPAYHGVPSKVIHENGRIEDYPKIGEWTWKQITVRAPFDIFDLVRFNAGNSILIRGTPQDTTQSITRRKKAADNYPTGFTDTPTAWIAFDVDGAPLPSGVNWLTDAEAAVRSVIACLGEAFRDVTVVWQFTGTHGLQKDASGKKWTGELISNSVRMRLYFLLDRAITCVQAINWVRILKGSLPKLDEAILRQVQPNYILPPHFEGGDDPIPQRVGIIRGSKDRVHVPDNLDQQTRWAHAEGIGRVEVAEHPDLHAAIAAIGRPLPGRNNGTIYPHLLAAAQHLLRQNPRAQATPIPAYVVEMTAALERIVRSERHMAVIAANLLRHNRKKSDVLECFQPTTDRYIGRWIDWLVEHPNALHLRKRVRRTHAIRRGRLKIPAPDILDEPLGRGLNRQPTGGGKSTKLRQMAVQTATAGTVVIAVPRHKLGEEQVEALRREYPDSALQFAIWRGRGAEDPLQQGKRMCLRYEEAQALEKVSLKVENALCQRGQSRCPLFDQCGYQRQKRAADIWFTAHESLVHEKPKVIGRVRQLLIDEDPLDALLWQDEIEAEEIRQRATRGAGAGLLSRARAALAELLQALPEGAVSKSRLQQFAAVWTPSRQIKREWAEKISPAITPVMNQQQVKEAVASAAGNALMVKRIKLWQLLEEGAQDQAPELSGRIGLKTKDDKRRVVMRGTNTIRGEFGSPTCIADASGDGSLLQHVIKDGRQEILEAIARQRAAYRQQRAAAC
jgi:hypothetical protein